MRCGDCPLTRLDGLQESEPGQLLKRALELRAALKLGVTVTLDEISADEFFAMGVIEQEVTLWEKENAPN